MKSTKTDKDNSKGAKNYKFTSNGSNKSWQEDNSPKHFQNLDTSYYGITDINLVEYLNIPYKDKNQEQITYVKDYIKKKKFFHRYINLIGNYRFLDLIERLEFQTFDTGDYLFKENEKSQFVYFLMSGELGADSIPLHKKYILEFYNWEYELRKSKKEARQNSTDCFKKGKKGRQKSCEKEIAIQSSTAKIDALYSNILRDPQYIDLFNTSEVQFNREDLKETDPSNLSQSKRSIQHSNTSLDSYEKKNSKYSTVFVPGATAGYLDVIYNMKIYSQSVKAQTPCCILKINTDSFIKIFEQIIKSLNKHIMLLMSDIHFFKVWYEIDLANLIKFSYVRNLRRRDTVYLPQSSDKNFYFVISGSVSIHKENKNYEFQKHVIDEKIFPGESMANAIKYTEKYLNITRVRESEMFGFEEGLFISKKKFMIRVDTEDCELLVIPRKKVLEKIKNKESFEVLKKFYKIREGQIEAEKYKQKKFGTLVYKYNEWEAENIQNEHENPYLEQISDFFGKNDTTSSLYSTQFDYQTMKLKHNKHRTNIRREFHKNQGKMIVLTNKSDDPILGKFKIFNYDKRKGTTDKNQRVLLPTSFGECKNTENSTSRTPNNGLYTNMIEINKQKFLQNDLIIRSRLGNTKVRKKVLDDLTQNIRKNNDKMLYKQRLRTTKVYEKSNENSHYRKNSNESSYQKKSNEEKKEPLRVKAYQTKRNDVNVTRLTKSIDLTSRLDLGISEKPKFIINKEKNYKFGSKKLFDFLKKKDNNHISGYQYTNEQKSPKTKRENIVTEPYSDPKNNTNFRDCQSRTSRGKKVLSNAGKRIGSHSDLNEGILYYKSQGVMDLTNYAMHPMEDPRPYLEKAQLNKSRVDNINIVNRVNDDPLSLSLTANNLYFNQDKTKRQELTRDYSNDNLQFGKSNDQLNFNIVESISQHDEMSDERKPTEEETIDKLAFRFNDVKSDLKTYVSPRNIGTEKNLVPNIKKKVSKKNEKYILDTSGENFEDLSVDMIKNKTMFTNKSLDITDYKLNQTVGLEARDKMTDILDSSGQFVKTNFQTSNLLKQGLANNSKGCYLNMNFDIHSLTNNDFSDSNLKHTNQTFDKGMTFKNESGSKTPVSQKLTTLNTTARIEKNYQKYQKYTDRKSTIIAHQNRLTKKLIDLAIERNVKYFNEGIYIDANAVRGSAEYNKNNNLDLSNGSIVNRTKPKHLKNQECYKDMKKKELNAQRTLVNNTTYEQSLPIVGALLKKVCKQSKSNLYK